MRVSGKIVHLKRAKTFKINVFTCSTPGISSGEVVYT